MEDLILEESGFISFSLPPSSGLITLEGEGQFVYVKSEGIVKVATEMGVLQVRDKLT